MQTQQTNNQVLNNQPINSQPVGTGSSATLPVSGDSKGTDRPSKLFYLLLILTVFIFVGLLLVVIISFKNSIDFGQKTLPSMPSITPTVSQVNAESSDAASLLFLKQQDSDEIVDIESDLKATDFDSLDEEAASIEASLP